MKYKSTNKNIEVLTAEDYRELIYKIKCLDLYLKESLSESEERLKFWEENAAEKGADMVVDILGNRTYLDLINSTKKIISNIENEVSENKLLIEKINSTLSK